MPDISHEVGGTIKNLSVVGEVVELPSTNLWLSYQLDAGLVISAGDVASWRSQGSNNAILAATGAQRPLHDTGKQLSGMNTVKFASSAPDRIEKTGASSLSGLVTHTIMVLVYFNARSGVGMAAEQTIFRYNGNTGSTNYPAVQLAYPTSGGGNSLVLTIYRSGWFITHTISTSSLENGWNIITVQFTANGSSQPIKVWRNDTLILDTTINTTIPSFAGSHSFHVGGYDLSTFTKGASDYNLGSLMWWNAILSADDLANAKRWLRMKYGVA